MFTLLNSMSLFKIKDESGKKSNDNKIKVPVCPFLLNNTTRIGAGQYCISDKCALWNPNVVACSLSYKSTCNTIE